MTLKIFANFLFSFKTTHFPDQEASKYAKPVYIRNGVSNQIPNRNSYDNGQVQVPPSSEAQDFFNTFASIPDSNVNGGGGGSFDVRASG